MFSTFIWCIYPYHVWLLRTDVTLENTRNANQYLTAAKQSKTWIFIYRIAHGWYFVRYLLQTHTHILYKLRYVQNTGTCYPGQGWFVRNLGWLPIGRSPGVPDKSSRGLGSMSRYSAQILICFIAYIFHFFYSSVSLVGNFAGLSVCTVPSAIVHCNQNEAGHQTIKVPSMPCWGATGPGKLSGIYATGLVKLTDKMDEICINGKFSVQEPSEWRVFCIPVSNFAVFQHRIWTDFRDVGSLVVLKI